MSPANRSKTRFKPKKPTPPHRSFYIEEDLDARIMAALSDPERAEELVKAGVCPGSWNGLMRRLQEDWVDGLFTLSKRGASK